MERLRDGLAPGDPESLAALLERAGVFRPEELAVARELLADGLARGPASEYRFLVALAAGGPTGYCCYGPIACTRHSWDLYWLAVDPDRHRAGLGRRLVVAAEARVRAAGGRRVYVETSGRPEYAGARRFYAACGYRPETVQADFYGPGDDKHTFVRVLDPVPAPPAAAS